MVNQIMLASGDDMTMPVDPCSSVYPDLCNLSLLYLLRNTGTIVYYNCLLMETTCSGFLLKGSRIFPVLPDSNPSSRLSTILILTDPWQLCNQK